MADLPQWLQYVGQFYRASTDEVQSKHGRGEMYTAPVFYSQKGFRYLEPVDADPARAVRQRWVIRTQPAKKKAIFDHWPVYDPVSRTALESDEVYAVLTAKRRPVVAFSYPSPGWEHYAEESQFPCCLVLPVFRFHEPGGTRWSEAVREFYLPGAFYLPADDELGFKEGWIDFERAQVLPKEWLVPRKMAVHPDLLQWIDDWFYHFLTGDLPRESALVGLRDYLEDMVQRLAHDSGS